jgi:hypothetical protein
MMSARVQHASEMKNHAGTLHAISAGLLLAASIGQAQVRVLDQFEDVAGWTRFEADGVNVSFATEAGAGGKAIRLDYDFTKGTGYGGMQKRFAMDLPENYEISFFLKADSPANNLEIKFHDGSGGNVWWVNHRNYAFPNEWKKIRIKKRHIQFAWGPAADQTLRRIERIEFTVSSSVGGKGTLWISNLTFEPLPPETSNYPQPTVTASPALEGHAPELINDGSADTFWRSRGNQDQEVVFDFTRLREFGGLHISWLKGHSARRFEVQLSRNGSEWETAYAVEANQSDASFIRLPEAEARQLRLHLSAGNHAEGFGIAEVKFLDIRSSQTPNDFLIYAAKNSPAGNYPRYFSEQASYWTVTGVNSDVKEGLINEDGMVEADKGLFSLEPMIKRGGQLYHWGNVKAAQSMGRPGEQGVFEFVPSVTWPCGDIRFEAGAMSAGQANASSALGIRYEFQNLSTNPVAFDFYVLIRPFQVNPHYQSLNLAGGAGKIHSISAGPDGQVSVDAMTIISQRKYDAFGAGTFDGGNVVDLLRSGTMPSNQSATDARGQAHGVIKYSLRLAPGASTRFIVAVPFYGKSSVADQLAQGTFFPGFEAAAEFWRSKVSHIKFNLPKSADQIVRTYQANLAYILVNRDKAGTQPGSRSYERSWIRDGALTCSALLKSGIAGEVRDFIDWYAPHQFENGKVPCVVDTRGPDPVPENDSNGELIFLIREYFNFTHDTAFLRSKNKHVLKAVEYLESLIAQRSTDAYKHGDATARACYGLVPESISHEGYSAKPMHSYWDDFFTMKGLKDATEIQRILGETEQYERIKKVRDTFRENLYHSLELAMKNKGINYIPGCVELGDFDATSTTIALTPCNESGNLPKPQVFQTFDRYYDYFQKRRDGQVESVNYTPYENRLIGSFILLDQPERAHELIAFFLNDQRPAGWNQWAEVVWKDYRSPNFIGDMPHTWVGSDFINAIRTMFVYENEADESLVLGAALYQDWIDAPAGMSVEHLPTCYGEVSYSIKRDGSRYTFSIAGDVRLPANGVKIKNFNRSKPPRSVAVNGVASKDFTEKEIRVREIPAEVVIEY